MGERKSWHVWNSGGDVPCFENLENNIVWQFPFSYRFVWIHKSGKRLLCAVIFSRQLAFCGKGRERIILSRGLGGKLYPPDLLKKAWKWNLKKKKGDGFYVRILILHLCHFTHHPCVVRGQI